MNNEPDRSEDAAKLRGQAEEIVRAKAARSPEDLEPLPLEAMQRVLHELRVHQIELEMQNEELRRTQAELEVSRARYFDLYDLAPVGYCTLSEPGLILEANLTLAALLGVVRGALVKQPFTRFILPEDQDIYYRHRKALFATGAPQVFELRIKKDSSSFWARLVVAVAGDADGAPMCRVVVSDITQRLRVEQALRLSEERLALVVKGSNDAPWDLDLEQDRVYWAPQWWRMLGYAVDELPADSTLWRRLAHPDDLARVERVLTDALHSGQENFACEIRLQHKDGHYVPILSRGFITRDASGKAVRVSGADMDLTERKASEDSLRQAAAVFENTREGVMITDAEQLIRRVNRAFTEITGYTETEVLGKKPSLLSSGRHDPAFYDTLWAEIGTAGHWRGEIWNRRKDGEAYPELLSISAVRDASGQVTDYVGVFADISRIKASEVQLDFLAHHDPLTALPNRLLLFYRLEHDLDLARREGRQLAFLMLDLDRFKDVNDSFGHLAGDELLQLVAERLRVSLRAADMVSRLGGDEFVVIMEGLTHPQDAAQIASGIIAALSEPWHLSNGAEVSIGVSIGISLFPGYGQTAEELLQQADAALYRAKREGRGNFKYFSEDLTQAARGRIDLQARLRRALAQNELRVHYQPLVDMASGRIVGAEALARWQDPDEGLILPDQFIPVAEQTGLIGAIGAWVLREACRQGREWLDAGLPPLKLSVNLSSHQLRHGDMGETLARVLAETGFPSELLKLELTESALMERGAEVVEIFDRMRTLGVGLAIDDFGTGYSSLAYLKHFPLDVLKIDKSFIDDIPHHQGDMDIASGIIAMGHTLRLKVLAEGVETAEQIDFLKAQGCDMYQGYLKSRPVPAEAFVALLQRELAVA